MGCTVYVLVEVELMNWWKLEESHPSFWFGFVFLGCVAQSWHSIADGSDAEFSFSQWSVPHLLG